MFDRRKIQRWRREIWRVFRQAGLQPIEISAALVLAGVAAVGTDRTVLSELTGLSKEYVQKVLRRLRQQRIVQGQALRTAWESQNGGFAAILDAMTAAGVLSRSFVDLKRSAAQKARSRDTYARGPRRPATKVQEGAVFTPKEIQSNPLYGLPKWEKR